MWEGCALAVHAFAPFVGANAAPTPPRKRRALYPNREKGGSAAALPEEGKALHPRPVPLSLSSASEGAGKYAPSRVAQKP